MGIANRPKIKDPDNAMALLTMGNTICNLLLTVFSWSYGKSGDSLVNLVGVGVGVAILGLTLFCSAISVFLLLAHNTRIHQKRVEDFFRLVAQRSVICQTYTSRKELYDRMQASAERCIENLEVRDNPCVISVTSYIEVPPKKDSIIAPYHDTMAEIIKNNEVQVRRVTAFQTKEKYLWVKSQIESKEPAFGDKFSLRWHRSASLKLNAAKNKKGRRLDFPINIQIYGTHRCFLLNPETNKRNEGGHPPVKNQYYYGDDAVEVLGQYYTELWDMCADDVIIENGIVRKDALAEIEAHLRAEGILDQRP